MISLCVKGDDGVWFGVACDARKVFATGFGFSKASVLKSLLEGVPFDSPFQYSEKVSTFAGHVLDLVKNVYYGKDVVVDASLAVEHLSVYAQNVIRAVSLVPVGYVTSYGVVAKAVGGSPRAVGRVMAMNPFAPLVPCHRVVCSDFTLGGYGGGLNVKLQLLKREKRGYISKSEISLNGKKLLLFPVENVLNKVKEEN
ncbi:MAG: MGMT family protein [Candidatus Bathyarchaeia archaeon]